MRLGQSIIDCMSRVRGIAQRMHGVTIDRIIPLFTIASLGHKIYPGVKSLYLVGYTVLVNCNLLHLSTNPPRNPQNSPTQPQGGYLGNALLQ